VQHHFIHTTYLSCCISTTNIEGTTSAESLGGIVPDNWIARTNKRDWCQRRQGTGEYDIIQESNNTNDEDSNTTQVGQTTS
jgi:hypothetical protein